MTIKNAQQYEILFKIYPDIDYATVPVVDEGPVGRCNDQR